MSYRVGDRVKVANSMAWRGQVGVVTRLHAHALYPIQVRAQGGRGAGLELCFSARELRPANYHPNLGIKVAVR